MTKKAFITGGAKRIGKEISLTLAQNGYDIALHYRHAEADAQQLAQKITEVYNVRVFLIKSDLNQETTISTMMLEAQEYLGSIDLLINNASCFIRDDWQNSPKEIWDENLAVNLRAPFLLMQAFARQAPKNSLIVNMLDSKLKNLHPAFTSYTLAKSGLYTLTKTMAQALAPHIRVNAIGPGPVLPSIHDTEKTWQTAAAQKTALKRVTDPKEIAETILWMVKAHSLTGQMIMLDNGEHLGWKLPY